MFTTDEKIGRRIHNRRRLLSLTQTQLGMIVGVSFQQIHKYECGSSAIAAARLWDLATALDVPVSYFFEEPQVRVTAASEEVFSTFRALRPVAQSALLGYAQSLAGAAQAAA